MFCNNCGTNNPDNQTFCSTCGNSLAPSYDFGNPYQPQPAYNPVTVPPEYKPISPWGYIGYSLLFSIPLVGLICIIVFACGSGGNKNVTNYARSYLWAMLIGVVLSILLGILFAAIGLSVYDMMYY